MKIRLALQIKESPESEWKDHYWLIIEASHEAILETFNFAFAETLILNASIESFIKDFPDGMQWRLSHSYLKP